jgi:hypothetical protein
MSERRSMDGEDWLSAGFNVVVGLFLGLALNGLLQIVVTGFWPVAAIMVVLALGFFLVYWLFEGLIVRPFFSGVRRDQGTLPEGKKPLGRLASLPLGLVLGFLLAQLGLTGTILAMF